MYKSPSEGICTAQASVRAPTDGGIQSDISRWTREVLGLSSSRRDVLRPNRGIISRLGDALRTPRSAYKTVIKRKIHFSAINA